MILRNTEGKSYELEREMTVGEFIKEIIEKDRERYLKYFRITLKAKLSGKNMVFYYQDGILKSQHTTGNRMDYENYMNYDIFESYGAKYISVDNIWDFEHDYEKTDCNINKVDKEHGKNTENKSNKEVCMEIIEEIKRKSEDKAKITKVQYPNGKEVTSGDLVECIRQIAWNMDKYNSQESSQDFEIDRLKLENKMLKSQIKWLEYKIDLLQKKKEDIENEEADMDKLFDLNNFKL
ncbi:hypothetical protein [Clostridium beijerinckii]|uniref:Uncharacterized protein n=1 Tax=Clostridium beijerinckii TaxID=1520 RepID=A0AAE5H0M6_CLOBE|nr:hypothetical protein [Clostridium beijerinckii]NSB12135.1 hypothetical protein [Clostridium beijerinckii]OOM23063.1 hypothetical protein CLOBE_42240 [Clostridium beijerinckii]